MLTAKTPRAPRADLGPRTSLASLGVSAVQSLSAELSWYQPRHFAARNRPCRPSMKEAARAAYRPPLRSRSGVEPADEAGAGRARRPPDETALQLPQHPFPAA